nr:S-layer homology domain-containing protein [Caloranaerobacter azorensis]
MAAKHVVNGYPDGKFKPNEKVTRAEFVKCIVKALELDLVKYNNEFKDVADSAWYADYVATAKAAGLVNGYPDGTFKPNQEITILEMASLLSKLVKDVDVKDTEIEDILRVYIDEREIPKWGRAYVARVSKAELMIGNKNNKFVPNGKTTRAEAATAIYRLYDKY